jgi:hypothetical protein
MPRKKENPFRAKLEAARAEANRSERKPLDKMTLEELEDEERRVKRELLEQQLERDLSRVTEASKQPKRSLVRIFKRTRRSWK